MSDARPGPPAPPPGPPRPSKQGSSITGRALILALVAVTLFLSLTVPVRQWFAQRAEIAQLRADVEAARDRVAALQLEKLRWDDPAFVAAEARRRLHFVLPGEVGYVALGTEKTQEEIAAEAAGDQPWYSTLWGAVRAADEATGSAKGSAQDSAKSDGAKGAAKDTTQGGAGARGTAAKGTATTADTSKPALLDDTAAKDAAAQDTTADDSTQ